MQTRFQRPVVDSVSGEPEDDPLLGTTLEDRYRLNAVLGEGGMGVVYLAEHLKLGRTVAVKVLQSELATHGLLRRRFEREAKTLAAMSHPHIVSVTDYGIVKDAPFLVMEFIEGQTLRECLDREGRLTLIRAIEVAEQLLQALAYAHGQGLIHRDLKPSNIALQQVEGKGDHIRVLDFGLAKFLAADKGSASSVVLTKTGAVMGTPAYMAPEQSVGGETDARTDVYAVGVILFEMLTGERPFEGEVSDLLRQSLLEPVPSVQSRRPELGNVQELDALIQKAAAKDPSDRFADGAEMLAALNDVRHSHIAPTDRDETGSAHVVSEPSAFVRLLADRKLWLSMLVAFAIIGLLLWFRGDQREVLGPDATAASVEAREAALAETESRAARHDDAEAQADQAPSQNGADGSSDLPPDPWQRAAPKLLREVKKVLDRGHRVSERSYPPLRRIGLRQKDGRAFVLLGRAYTARGWRTDAVEAFEEAVRIEPGVRGDPAILRSLIALMAETSSRRDASAAIKSIYGVEAVTALQEALAKPRLDAATKRGVAQLLSDLQK